MLVISVTVPVHTTATVTVMFNCHEDVLYTHTEAYRTLHVECIKVYILHTDL
jgi:hypothetical protein